MAVAALVAVSSCNSSSSTEQPATAGTPELEAATADSASAAQTQQMAYVCPMNCENSASMEPGKCPVCGMDLERNPAFPAPADSTGIQ
jgi:rubrerythrin